ncbi:hypothetical protein NQ314_006881 [Rhamnusium bicolor]|uniref:Ribosomal protein S7 n=1 Tax=Rhamnusium bicolor TaxID=1586634 RepID=A0AAV8YUQ8_9CUCU|nr:hypothetical protein NQ314_006881 [Rhamnusium bicolor]
MRSRSLTLAPEKTEAVFITGRRRHTPINIEVEGVSVQTRSDLKYLGVRIDSGLNYGAHLTAVAAKASKTVAALSRLMPNIGGPRGSKRKLLSSVAHSVMLYSAEIWREALNKERHHNKLKKVQRKIALRIYGTYRNTSVEAVMVVAGIIPIKLQVEERNTIYNRQRYERDIRKGPEKTP